MRLGGIIIIFMLFFTSVMFVFASTDDLDSITKKINELSVQLEESKKATKPLEQNVSAIEASIKDIENNLKAIMFGIKQKETEINKEESRLEEQKKSLDKNIREYYKQSRNYVANGVGYFFSNNLPIALRKYFYQQKTIQKDRTTILKTAFLIKALEGKKISLEYERVKLAKAQSQLDKEKRFFETEIIKAENYQRQLEDEIKGLTKRQQELLEQKIASIPVPLSAETSIGGCVPDVGLDGSVKDSGFGGKKFGFFSYGVPNKTGLNQYGARGRAQEGQSFEQILSAYYSNFELKKDYDTGITINVEGYGAYSIEDYVKRIYEMPDSGSWAANDLAALKAQAIVVRSYALAYTNNGQGPICTTQQCQVFKPELKGGNWERAVDETRGYVMLYNGAPLKAWYSTTHGGVVLKTSQIGWSDTPWTKSQIDASASVASFDDLKKYAYDRDSPWFYCDWGYRSQYNSTAWLTHDEALDIVNAYVLYLIDKNTIIHLSQVDQPGPDTWDISRVRDEIRNRGGTPFSSLDSIYVEWDGSGISRTIVINNNRYDAQQFKNLFNLRAPANIQIKPACHPSVELSCSGYALYDVETR